MLVQKVSLEKVDTVSSVLKKKKKKKSRRASAPPSSNTGTVKHPGERDSADRVFSGTLWIGSNLCDQQQDIHIGKFFASPDQTK